ncbi:MAG: hypothetical protein R3D98_17065 [Candidatus Krumholzibacteriia bacterium]
MAFAVPAGAADGQKLQWTGVNYTKFLSGNRHYGGSMYNFTTIPGEGFGDNGQGTEFELLFNSKPSSKIEVNGRIKSRFNQNQWTNWGGFGGSAAADGIGGNRGEFEFPQQRVHQVARHHREHHAGLQLAQPGHHRLDDFGMFDPFTIGKIRYIDRDNGKGPVLSTAASWTAR